MSAIIKFDAVNHAHCTQLMIERCNDGRAWSAFGVFGRVTAKAHDSAASIPRAPAGATGELDSIYWQNGKWHPRRPPTTAEIRKEQDSAYVASGVADGGSRRKRRKVS